MSYIETVPRKNAPPDTAAAYDYHDVVAGGRVPTPNIMRAFSLSADSMRATIEAWDMTMWNGSAARADRELVGAMVSRLNQCFY